MERESAELLVIGAGPGGYVAAIRAGQLGLDVTLVDEEAWGGMCLNVGCIPSKALITATDVVHDAQHAEDMGIYADVDVAVDELTAWKDGVVGQLTTGVERLCKANGVTLVEGRAEFVDKHTARIVDASGGGADGKGGDDEAADDADTPQTIDFEHAVIATGSRPIQVPGFDFTADPVWSSRDVLALDQAPDRLVVVGAGYIGMELSTVLAKLGTDVTVVEMLDSALPVYEDDVARPVKKRAESLGIDFSFGEGAADWSETDDGIAVTTETEDGEQSVYEADAVLVAVGRRAVTNTLNLEAIGLKPNKQGVLETDDRTRTDLDHIFAVGDVAGEPMLAHKASAEGLVAAAVAAGENARLDHVAIPAAVFTDPEIGTVGLTEAEAEEQGHDPIVGEMPLRASGRALTMGETDGFVRVVAAADGTILGAQAVAPEASELVAELALAIEHGLTVEDLGSTVHTHPTLSEAVMEAAENALDQAIHTLNR